MSERKGKKRGKGKNQEAVEAGGACKVESKYSELFRECREELDAKHDRHERLVKLSRDCTIQSKRAIFTLHQFSGCDENRAKVLEEAEAKINTEVLPILHSIALELAGTDPHKHHYAYSPGVQEFIEALAYYTYLKTGTLISFEEAQKYLTFNNKESDSEEVEKSDISKEDVDVAETGGDTESANEALTSANKTVMPLALSDFLLGLADLTGELMRLCINSVGSGNRELPFSLLPFFRALYCGFHFFGPGLRQMKPKMSALRSSLGKVENVCYNLKVRGSEMPKQMLMDVINTNSGSVERPDE